MSYGYFIMFLIKTFWYIWIIGVLGTSLAVKDFIKRTK